MRSAAQQMSLERVVRRGRELPALALLAVWLFGLVIAPALHQSVHAWLGSHSHAPVIDSHAHDGSTHAHVDLAESDEDEAPADHGRGSQLHGDVAALFPAPAFVLPPFVAFGDRARPVELEELHGILPPPVAVARGPPRRA